MTDRQARHRDRADGTAPPRAGGTRGFRFGLRAKVAVFFASLLLVVNAVVLLTQKEPIVRVLERNFRTRGEELALNLAARTQARIADPRGDALRDLVEVFLEFEDVSGVAILMPDGKVLAAAPGSEAETPPPARPGPREVLVRRGEEAADFLAAVPGSVAVARVRLSSRALSDTVARIGRTIASIAALAVGTGFLLVFVAASAFTRPIERLTSLARRIRAGELGARLDLRRSDEIGELGTAMDAMSVELAEKERGLRAAKEAVETQYETVQQQGRELAAQTRNLETLVASISEGVLFLGPDRRVAIANRTAEGLLGAPAGGLCGVALTELRFPEPDAPLATLLAEACAQAARNERHHSEVCLADHLHTVTTIHEPGGDALGVLAIVRDLSKIRALETEQKELLDQLYQQEKMAIVGLLAASLAHDLNTPLGTILLHTQRVARELGGGEESRALGTVEQEVHRCRDIVRRLLDFSRVAESRPVVLDLAGPVELSISLAEAGLRQKGISIRKSVAPDVPLVQADAHQMEQVLVNLIWNAADAMPRGGSIEIRLRRAAGGAELWVRDDGKGILPEHAARVFEPFFTTKPPGKGTGLGLAICRRIVEEHGGSIDIEPRPEGGTAVRMYLPATNDRHA
ncbi:MAG: sensor histidine kinase [Planctomycetota bacterium]|jgi:signal transduction histidine kinase/HAMP domain-containing protein